MVTGTNAQQANVQVQPQVTVSTQNTDRLPTQNATQQSQVNGEESGTVEKRSVSPEYRKMQSEIHKKEVQPLRTQLSTLEKELSTMKTDLSKAKKTIEAYTAELDAPYSPETLKDAKTLRDMRIRQTNLEAEIDTLKSMLEQANGKLSEGNKSAYAREKAAEVGIPVEPLLKLSSPEEIDRVVELTLAIRGESGNNNQTQVVPQAQPLPNTVRPSAAVPAVAKTAHEIALAEILEAQKRPK